MEMTVTVTLLELFKFLFVFAFALLCGLYSAALMVTRARAVDKRNALLKSTLPAGKEPGYRLQIILASVLQIIFLLQLGYWFAQYAS
jgi:hypothetical protein